MANTIGDLIGEARTLLQDKVQLPVYRYSDDELMRTFNAAMNEVRTKRPDLFLGLGLRTPLTVYVVPGDLTTTFPFDMSVYNAVVYYLVGRTELREDTFADDSRAVGMMNKFNAQLLSLQS